LFYRLNVVSLQLPPLRERRSDIKRLAETFLSEACEEHSLGDRHFSEQAYAQLERHSWPGNIRELKNLVERTAILSEEPLIDTIEDLAPAPAGTAPMRAAETTSDALPATGDFAFNSGVGSWQDFHEAAGKAYLKFILRRAGGNVSEAARMLCLERAYLHRLMKKLGVQRDVVVLD
jgi:DNA-binding NtrC family response regulator